MIQKLLITAILLLSGILHAQKYTSSQGMEHLEIIARQSNPNKKMLEFLSTHGESSFVDGDNYYTFLQEIDTLFYETEPHYAELIFFVGKRLHLSNQYKEAFPYLYKTQLLTNAGRSYDFECDFYEIMGLSYFFFKRYEQSKTFLNKALYCDKTIDHAKINILNTLGLIYSNSEWKKAEEYYRKAIEIAQQTGNKPWFGVASGNLGALYFKKKEYDLAKEYLNMDFSISEESGETESAITAMSTLLEIDLLQNNTDSARIKMYIIDSIVQRNKNKTTYLTYCLSKALWNEHIQNYSEALRNYKSAQKIRDSINVIRNQVNANNTEFQIDFEHRQAKIQVLQEQSRTSKKITIVLAILTLVITIGAFVSIRQILKRKKQEKEVLELKNKQVKEDLERTEQEMQNTLKSLMERNKTISRLTEELEGVFMQMDRTEEEHKNLTDKLQTFKLLTDDDWVQFKRLFEKRHPGFFDYFYSNHEDITNAEIRLAALLKLNMENLEISKALGIGSDSVRKTNLRLRKRLDISDQKDLQKLIQSI